MIFHLLEITELLDIIKDNDLTVSLMHMQGTPKNMQDNPKYVDVVDDIFRYLNNKVDLCTKHGVSKDRIIVDPGFGFGKTLDHNYIILNQLNKFSQLQCKVFTVAYLARV